MKKQTLDGLIISLAILCILDIILTIYGLNLGFKEGNKMWANLITLYGITITMTIGLITHALLFYLILFVRKAIIKYDKIMILGVSILLSILIRSYVVVDWVVMIREVA